VAISGFNTSGVTDTGDMGGRMSAQTNLVGLRWTLAASDPKIISFDFRSLESFTPWLGNRGCSSMDLSMIHSLREIVFISLRRNSFVLATPSCVLAPAFTSETECSRVQQRHTTQLNAS
jgi:hypothetical protein